MFAARRVTLASFSSTEAFLNYFAHESYDVPAAGIALSRDDISDDLKREILFRHAPSQVVSRLGRKFGSKFMDGAKDLAAPFIVFKKILDVLPPTDSVEFGRDVPTTAFLRGALHDLFRRELTDHEIRTGVKYYLDCLPFNGNPIQLESAIIKVRGIYSSPARYVRLDTDAEREDQFTLDCPPGVLDDLLTEFLARHTDRTIDEILSDAKQLREEVDEAARDLLFTPDLKAFNEIVNGRHAHVVAALLQRRIGRDSADTNETLGAAHRYMRLS